MVVIKIKKILKAIMFTLLWFLALTTVCIAVKGIIYVIGLLIGEAIATLLSIILLLIFIAVLFIKNFYRRIKWEQLQFYQKQQRTQLH